MYVVESEDQNTELDKVTQKDTNGVGNSAFTYDYTTSNNGWVDE